MKKQTLAEKLKNSISALGSSGVKERAIKAESQNNSFTILTDEEISLVLAHRAKKLRVYENIQQKEFSKNANLSATSTYSNFELTGKASLINFIKIVRAFGRIKELEPLLKQTLSQKVDEYETNSTINKKRVRHKNN